MRFPHPILILGAALLWAAAHARAAGHLPIGPTVDMASFNHSNPHSAR